MTDTRLPPSPEQPVESVLRDELANGDVVLGTVTPILGHLLANQSDSLFSDEIVARVRGMLSHITDRLLAAPFADHDSSAEFLDAHRGSAAEYLVRNHELLAHCHSLALEYGITSRLEARCAIDPVLSPLLQSLIASDDAEMAARAMAVLAAQARFMQAQQHMELPIEELPGDLFDEALGLYHHLAADHGVDDPDAPDFQAADAALRRKYDEGTSRIGLLQRMAADMGKGARAALSISHAGTPMFFSALAHLSNQPRELAIIAADERQLARLALALRSAGLKPDEVEEQFVYFHPEVSLPDGFDKLRTDRAAAILAAGLGWAGV